MNQMKRIFGAIAAGALAVALTLTGQSCAAEASAAIRLRELRCESQSNPLGIDATAPRLSWKLDDARRGARQTVYRVLVASTPAKLAADEGDLWDTAKVVSDQSHLVEYGGKPLESGQIVHWKAKVWDKDGQESPWSEPARWEMGLLKPEDWKARWLNVKMPVVDHEDTDKWFELIKISGGRTNSTPGVVEKYRKVLANAPGAMVVGKDFTIDQPPLSARLYSSMNGGYRMIYLNGQRVGVEERDPAQRHGYDTCQDYTVHDVTSLLRKGDNRIRCLVWSEAGSAKVVLQMDTLADDGQRGTALISDDTWKQTRSPRVKYGSDRKDIRYGEIYDARIPDALLDDSPATGEHWQPVPTSSGTKLVARRLRPERITRRVTPVEVYSPAPGIHIFDMGEMITGNIEWHIPSGLAAGDRVFFRFAGALLTAPDGQPNTNASLRYSYPAELKIDDWSRMPGYYFRQNRYFDGARTEIYVANGQDTGTWRSIMDPGPFRYVEVIGLKKTPETKEMIGLLYHTAHKWANSNVRSRCSINCIAIARKCICLTIMRS